MIKLLKLYWLDILNYIYFRKVVAKYNKSEQWKRLNLRQNRIGEIYTVVRLRDEDLGDPDEIMTTRLMEICRERNLFIADMDVQFAVGGLVTVDYYFITDDPNAFLVIWQPKIQVVNFPNTIKFIMINAVMLIFIIFALYFILSTFYGEKSIDTIF
jgi:hypothetical protein